jgi:phosphatidylglycerol---prolipoprotein diacylglyceryl transferase
MYRELFRIPFVDVPIYGFGLMLVLGCWLAIELAKFLAKRSGLNPEHFVNIGIIALLGGVVGARASHVFENWSSFFGPQGEGLWSAINIRSGGLTYYGGVMLATPLCIWYGLRNDIPIRRGMDIIAPALMVGLAIGRVGCFLNGCCWGAVCDKPWAVTFPYGSPPYEAHVEEGRIPENPSELIIKNPLDPMRAHLATSEELRKNPRLAEIARTLRSEPVHPSQLYSTATALLVGGILIAYYAHAPTPGRVFALMMMLEGVGRFTLETLRIEPAVAHFRGVAFSFSMVLGVVLVVAGIVLWFAFPMLHRRLHAGPTTPSLA